MPESPIGCHALVWTGVFDSAGIVSSIARSKSAGFDLVEFPLMDPDTFDGDTARRALSDAGMSATTSLGLPQHIGAYGIGESELKRAADELGGKYPAADLLEIYLKAL